jgi:hypothetical protein
MTRPRNAGLIQHNGRVVEGVWLPGEPILDLDTHHRLVALYVARKRGRQPSGKYLLTGIATCGLCDSPLSGRPVTGTNRRHYWCKYCRRISVEVARLDDWAADWAIDVLSDAATASAIESEARARAERRARLEREVDSRKELKLLLADRLGRGELELDEYDAAARPIAAQIDRLRAEIDELRTDADVGNVNSVGKPYFVHAPRDAERGRLLIRWEKGPAVDQRAIVRAALRGRRIVVGPGRAARFDPARCEVR